MTNNKHDENLGQKVVEHYKDKKTIQTINQDNFDFSTLLDSYTRWLIKTGTPIVPLRYIDEQYNPPYPLGSVLKSLRLDPVTGKPKIVLNQEQNEILKDLGFNNNTSFRFDSKEFLDNFLSYIRTHKSPVITQDYVTPQGYPLGKKLNMVINGYLVSVGMLPKSAPHINVEPNVYSILRALGQPVGVRLTSKKQRAKEPFDYDKFVSYWIEYYLPRIQYEVEYPFYIAPSYSTPDGYPLGNFCRILRVTKMRIEKRLNPIKKEYVLTEEQWKTLNTLNVFLSVPQKHVKILYDFDKDYAKLVEYKQEFGNLLVSSDYHCKDGTPLGLIVKHYRRYAQDSVQSNVLTPLQKQKLNDIGFIWSLKDYAFEIFCNHFEQYTTEHNGDKNVPSGYICKDGYKLGAHCRAIRRQKPNFNNLEFNKTKLSTIQYHRLNELGFPWVVSNKKGPAKDVQKHTQRQSKDKKDNDKNDNNLSK